MKLAAIDIGSNSIHMVIVRAVKGQHPEIIDREKEMVRLGAGSLREHLLSKEKIERAVTTLRRYKQMAEANRVDLIIATATSAVRESHNADEFIETMRREVGLDVQLLPGFEEARLIALAVSAVTDFHNRRALIIDIGGGSTEFIVTGGGEPELLFSVRIGAVRLAEKFITTDPISQQERERLITGIRSDLTHAVWEIKNRGYDFVIG
ncbi:MAG TPA: Ppx/GppA family phosphatase, partial [Blastocatellia bacterium]|nr:Ppx/GppA family phosphatase [Blastocatellia bacterium]